MKSIYFAIIGVISAGVIAAATVGILEYQSVYNHNCNSDGGYVVGFLSCTHIREDFAGPKIQGEMADEICTIIGGECPPYYIGNIQEDGSVMVGMTFSDGIQEKQFVFLINNETLSYKEYVNGKPVTEPELENDKHDVVELFKNIPEVKAFHLQYEDTQTSVRDDHISYFSGSEGGYLARMNLYFDENYVLETMDFHCYYQKVHQFELPQEDIVSELKKYDCKEYAESKNEN